MTFPRVTAWSHDGRSLAIAAVGGAPGVWTYSFETKTYQRVTSEPTSGATFLRDGKHILYGTSDRLRTLNTMSGASSDVLRTPGEVLSYPALARDDSQLYFIRASATGDLWLLRFSEPAK